MNTIQNSSSSFNDLPDDIILQIFNKLTNDLKTLFFCHQVSKRFSLIVLQIHTISFTAPRLLSNTPVTDTSPQNNLFQTFLNGVVFKPLNLLRRFFFFLPATRPLPPIISSFYGDSFRSAVSFLTNFKTVKSLQIELPYSSHKGIENLLFKWNVVFSNRIQSFMFLSPNFVSNNHELGNNDNNEISNDMFKKKVHIAFQCLKDVIVRHRMMLYFIKDFPLLENVCITDSGKRGKLCLSGRKVSDVREWVNSDVKPHLSRIEVPVSVSQCFLPTLELPVSGYVMKGVTFVVMHMSGNGKNDGFVNGDVDGFEEEEAAYREAVMEILENHKEKMMTLL
uniref:uncharacterized protein LOC122602391 n=1 Tax=Erigeron canadensis TaxID=72917 RepID=UPI001CB8BB76|nr:uncharacterized protein LOC122602391 [Erigeron canadensis]XP_043631017.1 uncharacterized protein LOC122602391 [Erigeron canadensis]